MLACPAVESFSKRLSFRVEKKRLLNIKRVFLFPLQLLSEIFLILRIERDFIYVHMSYCTVPDIRARFHES